MSEVMPLREAVRVRGRFQRSVQLLQDWQNEAGLDGYLLTPTARRLSSRIIAGLKEPTGPRAWSITGPYGTGKSAFALFLADLLASEKPRHPVARELKEGLLGKEKPFLPVLVIGKRQPLKPALLDALEQSLKGLKDDDSTTLRTQSRSPGDVDDATVTAAFEAASRAATQAGYAGLMVILDEFGKFLEHASLNPEEEDLFVMQSLAETAGREETPMILLTLLHTAFTEYLQASAEESRRAEWSKVQGRFADVAFQEPPEQLLRLVGSAIEEDLPADVRQAYDEIAENALTSDAFAEARRRLPLEELLPECVPLDPVVALLLWPLFRSKLAQNERSLFAFLTSEEPFSFAEFLYLSRWEGERPPVYRVDRLYDYVTDALGSGARVGESGKRWAEIDHSLSRVGVEAPALSGSVVKAIGIIGAYGKPAGLRPSPETLKLALGAETEVDEALSYLQRTSIVVYRRHEEAFGLWQGSDVDLEERFEEALEHIGRAEPARRLEKSLSLRPIVARAHYIEKGTLRYFDVRLIEGKEKALEERAGHSVEADGEIVYVICHSDERKRLIEKARELTASNTGKGALRIFAFPKPLLGLEEALKEVEGWRWVGENEQALQGDPVARNELRARLQAARWRLEEIAGGILGLRGHRFDPTASEWVRSGRTYELSSAREFTRWLSELCDTIYYRTPTLRNELLNRDRLSSAAAKARRNLLEGMLEREDEHRLGFEGTPAEVSMYESLLRAGGFHEETEEGWTFSTPGENWKPIWEAMNDFLATTEDARKPLAELFSALKRPPYGLREGPLPILVCAYVLGRNEEVALYEDGLFVPEPYIELFERLLRSPENFEIRQFTLSERGRDALAATRGVVEALVEQTGSSVAEQSRSAERPGLLEVVKPLVVAAAQLPAYARRTRRVEPPEAVPLRNTLLRAKDPYDLIFSDIPEALGLSLGSDEDVDRLPDLLRECLLGLQRAYPLLLDELESHVREALGLYGSAQEAVQQLKSRAEPLVEYAGSQTTGLFVREAANIDSLGSKDWRETLGRVLNNGTPPYEWRDRDLVGFQVRLREVSSDFVRLEEMVAEKQQTEADTRIFRIGVLDGRLEEARGIVSLPPDRHASVEELADKIVQTIGSSKGDRDRRERLAALALVAMEYLNAEGSTDGE